jgi:hypothetical protein
MTEVEEFLFTKLQMNNAAPFLRNLSFSDGTVSIEVVSFPDQTSTVKATFNNAVMETLWFDDDPTEWPLDIMGFDCYPLGGQHRFVLNCSSVEWGWRSDWPTISDTAVTPALNL